MEKENFNKGMDFFIMGIENLINKMVKYYTYFILSKIKTILT